MNNLAHSASFESLNKNAPSKPGIKHRGLEFGAAFEGSQLLAGCSAVEVKFGLLEKEGKVGFRNAAVSAEGALGLVPEVLDSIDVIVAIENVGV